MHINNKYSTFYLFASYSAARECSPAAVVYEADTEPLAKSLCILLAREYAHKDGMPAFHCEPSSSFSDEEQVLLAESLQWLAVYKDPDPEAYDPVPSEQTLRFAQFHMRAEGWARMLRDRATAQERHEEAASAHADRSEHASPTNPDPMPAEDRRNSALILLMMLAQAYYKMLECAISPAAWFASLDLGLNDSYFWTVNNIKNLLGNHEDLRDFPEPFEPAVPDLYPTTLADLEWQDMIAPEAERFLSEVHRYVHAKGFYDPEQGSPAWTFIELFRPSITAGIERAIAYDERMRQYTERARRSSSQRVGPDTSGRGETAGHPGAERAAVNRNSVFISYSHKDRKFLDELLSHLRPLERAGRISAWSDKQIQPGSQWFDEIQKALAATRVAVLLVTKDFLASDFIHDHEFGPILKQAASGGVAIVWVLVRACNWKKTPLDGCQAAYPTDKPLAEMRAERDRAWVAICEKIEAAANAL